MKKLLICAAAVAAMVTPAFAGGLVTNTNQNAAFLRQFSQGAIIDITGLYMNPAGTAFLSDGWHLSINTQNAKQRREISTSFPLFAFNTNTPGQAEHEFVGKAYAPVIPSIQVSRNFGKWSVNGSFALIGGGGKCEFDKGLGSFEALYAGNLYTQVPAAVKAQLPGIVKQQIMANGIPEATAQALAASGVYGAQLTGYDLNAYMKGRSYQFGLTLGTTYKLRDNLALYGGLRVVYATNNYNGWVEDINASYLATYEVAAAGLKGSVPGTQTLNDSQLSLNTDQSGFGLTPILGIDWKINDKWNVAAKYEFKTRLRLENKSEMNQFAQLQSSDPTSALAQFKDGAKVASDIPSIFVAGVQYSPFKFLRFMLTADYYDDKQATTYGNKNKELNNSYELIAGFEWDICKFLTFSASVQNTNYDQDDSYMNDLSFNLSSNSLGTGFRVNATKRTSIDLGYMHTIYKDRTVTTTTAAGPKVDKYHRTNRVLGLGVNIAF